MQINPLKKILSAGAKETVQAVADVVDQFVANPQEKEAARAAVESEITKRWDADMDSDSWLSKNVRPLGFITVLVFLMLMTFFDGAGITKVDDTWIGLWEIVTVTIVGGYFAVRTIDKRTRKVK